MSTDCEVSIYMSSYEQYCDDKPMGSEVATAIETHVQYLIAGMLVPTMDRSLISSLHTHDTGTPSSGALTMRCQFSTSRAAKHFFFALASILDADPTPEFNIIRNNGQLNGGLANYSVEAYINKNKYFGHILMRL